MTTPSSGIATCPADVTVNGEGADQAVTGTSVDRAGNTSTTTVLVDVDRTAPVITATVASAANADGWYTAATTVHFTCTDTGSGIAVCPEDTEVTEDGKAQTLSGIAVDRASNTAEASVTLNADLTAPEITATVIGDANADGWYKTAPTVHFTCTDAAAGIASCPADAPVDLEGTSKVVAGTAVDKVGHVKTASVTLNVDRTAPAIKATVVETANAGGWYKTAPTVHFTCTDTGSGIATCPADTTVTTNGAAQKISGTAVDKAGNTATAAVSVNVDLVAPEIAATVDGTKNAAGWYKTAPTVRYACTDTVSAVAACPAAKAVTTEGAAISVAGTGTDKAQQRHHQHAGAQRRQDRTGGVGGRRDQRGQVRRRGRAVRHLPHRGPGLGRRHRGDGDHQQQRPRRAHRGLLGRRRQGGQRRRAGVGQLHGPGERRLAAQADA
nr:hypothetical protein GCM10020092_066430 [Actinoplanes digitatis]